MVSLRIEGWRGVNHSYALVNQHQILHLARMPGLKLSHLDLPFAFGHWSAARNTAGFSPEDAAVIEGLPAPDDGVPDAVYRICSPYRAPDSAIPTTTFMATELGLTKGNFDSDERAAYTHGGNCIATTSHWGRALIVEYGFPAERVHVVSLGVDRSAFFPTPPDERQAGRTNLGFHDDETVFLNIGVAVWNKGIDLVLRAFAQLRRKGLRVRLILKDQRDVYGIGVDAMVQSLVPTCPELADPDTIAAISVIPGNLSQTQLRQLFGLADCYVSPYRAEGFNLPVLEAIACGLPVIASRGGATDDFCSDDVGWRIDSKPGTRPDPASGETLRFVEPEFDDLVTAMTAYARGMRPDAQRLVAGRERIVQTFTWQHAAEQVAALAVPQCEDVLS
jgi:glycosyltransferase involved in cell wall biosynthesis